MKKIISLLVVIYSLGFTSTARAQMRMNPSTDSKLPSTLRLEPEAQAGQHLWDQLQTKVITCNRLTDENFSTLGDFFMVMMMGDNHDAMDQMMADKLGDAGGKMMHISIGKRLSGCDPTAPLPQGASYFAPMLGLSPNKMFNNLNESNLTKPPIKTPNRWLTVLSYVAKISLYFAALSFLTLGSWYFLTQIKTQKTSKHSP